MSLNTSFQLKDIFFSISVQTWNEEISYKLGFVKFLSPSTHVGLQTHMYINGHHYMADWFVYAEEYCHYCSKWNDVYVYSI